MTSEQEALYRAAIEADDAWQAELVKRYPGHAGDARYDSRGTANPRLRELWKAKRAADDAVHADAMERHRAVHNPCLHARRA